MKTRVCDKENTNEIQQCDACVTTDLSLSHHYTLGSDR